MLTIGIDDAGRGPIIGPMIVAGVLTNNENKLKEIGAKDSKMLLHSARVKLSSSLKEGILDSCVIKISPEEIDEFVLNGKNLNTLEAIKMADLINKLNTKKDKIKVVVDCPSVNLSAWRDKLVSFINHTDNLEIICEHKADANHPSVSAASILAKVAREEEVDKIKKEFGDIGSGYPSDPYTKEFLKTHGKKLENSGIFRKSWATWKALYSDKQKSLLDY